VQLYQVDERCVPPDDEQSNFRMIRESLLLKTSITESQFRRVQGELPPVEAARLVQTRFAET
jgi:6-phosphogluconolactonase